MSSTSIVEMFWLASNGFLGALAQQEFLDLAGRGLWQWPKDDRPGRLEVGKALAAKGDDLVRRRSGFGLQCHERAGGFAPHRVRARDHRRLEHARVPVENVFDLDRRDVLAARDDDVLRTILQLDIAVGMHDPEIARMKLAAGKGLLRGSRVLQVTLHDDVAA